MLRVLPIACAAVVCFLGAAQAQTKFEAYDITVSGSVGLATDYMFRGVSQTQTDPAIQGALEIAHGSGLYLGTFASNVDFPGADANIEIDIYGGYRFEVAGVSLDVGGIYYAYPGARESLKLDYVEAYLKASYEIGIVTLVGGVYVSPDYQTNADLGIYMEGGADVKLPFWDLVLSGRLGRQWIENNARWGTPDFTNWSLGVSKELIGITFAVAYYDTDLSKGECFGGTNLCQARVVASATKKF